MPSISIDDLSSPTLSPSRRSKRRRQSEAHVAFCSDEFPIYIVPQDVVPLWTQTGDDTKVCANRHPTLALIPLCLQSFATWLNGTTIDAIVMLPEKPEVDYIHAAMCSLSLDLFLGRKYHPTRCLSWLIVQFRHTNARF